jgi:hypothetical protein
MFIILIRLIHERIRQLPGANLWTPTRALPCTHWGLQGSPQKSCLFNAPLQKILDLPMWFPHVSIRQVPLQYSQSKTHYLVVVVEGFHFICHFLFVYDFPLTLLNFIYSRGILKVDSHFDQYWTPLPLFENQKWTLLPLWKPNLMA